MKEKKTLNWIKGFSKISVKSICEDLKINRGNLLNGKSTDKNAELVKKAIEERLKELDYDEELSQHIPRID